MAEKILSRAKKEPAQRAGEICSAHFAQDGNGDENDDHIEVEDEAIGVCEYIGAGEDGPGELAEKIHQDEERQESPEAGAADDGAAVFVAAFSGKSVEGEDDDEYDAKGGIDVDEGDAVHQRVDGLVDR